MKPSLRSKLQVSKPGKRKQDDDDAILDLDFYRESNPDLHGLSDGQLKHHWVNHGESEGRSPNLEVFVKVNQLDSIDNLSIDIDVDFYLACYPDVKKSGVSTELQAKLHWLKFGRKENRCRSISEWLARKNMAFIIELSAEELYSAVERNKSLSFEQVVSPLCGVLTHTVQYKTTSKENSEFYYDLAYECFERSKQPENPFFWYQAALKAARTAYSECSQVRILELIGNLHQHHGDHETACAVYRHLASLDINKSQLFEADYADFLVSRGKYEDAIDVISSGIRLKPELTYFHEKLDAILKEYFLKNQGSIQLLSLLDDRQQIADKHLSLAQRIYRSYYQTFSLQEDSPLRPRLTADRILIVGDYHVPQCIRYRIDQKVEQLELQGKEVTTINWTSLGEHQNALALHDVVIFYRVPAVPDVLKAMAQVNANGKASFYEIDDLLFEESYPAPIETFGGYIGLDTHLELRKSMASFRAAVSFCRYAISSTQLLCDKLETLVMDKQCLLHRNGLDKLNTIRSLDKSSKKTVDIFYGSGTQAHNSDFIEQALPAIERILDKFKHARLIIAGYLRLPSAFTDKYQDQLQQLPPVNNVKAYWSFLEHADINLAVLNDDEINGCKSELKWFEAACFSIPSVVSSTANYRDVIKHGEDGFIVSNHEEWFEALNTLITRPEMRSAIALKALERVQSEYSIEALGKSLVEKLDSLLTPEAEKKKKIALVNVFFPPQSIGGATRVLSDNFDLLQQQYGDEYELVAFTSDDHCTTPYKLSAYQHQGVTVYRSSILYRENMDWHPKDPEMYEVFEQFLEFEKPDLVHFHCVQRLTASVVEATKDKNIPYIVTAHDAWWISDHQFLIDGDNNVYPEGHPDIYAPRTLPNNVSLGDSIERINYLKDLLSGAKSILTVSEGFAEIYQKNGYPQTQVNKNGISMTTQWQSKDTAYTEKVVCGHIGGMANHKGYFLLKDAIEATQPDNIEMLIVDHSKPEGYEHKENWGNVPVTFIGRVNQNKIVDVYQKIDVLFAPSLWPESYGLVTREAAACGCWVVASNLGGISEDIIEGKTGYKVEPEIGGLSEIIAKISKDKKQYKALAEKTGIRFANQQVDELIGIYNE